MDGLRNFCEVIEERLRQGGVTVTWLNHYSARNADWEAIRNVDFVGIDGTLLQVLLRLRGVNILRTSADLVLPDFLARESVREARLALIGGVTGVAEKASSRLTQELVFVADGFDGLATLRANPRELVGMSPDIVLIGIGAGLQDRVAVEVGGWLPDALIFTVGGWLDQLAARPQYFPPIVHRLRLGWLWRLLHEPKRLIRRYTLDAVYAITARASITARLCDRHNMKDVLLSKD